MLGPEVLRSHKSRAVSGFYQAYMSGRGLDFGFKGEAGDLADPVLPNCLGVDLGTPGYDGVRLAGALDGSYDFVFSSHCFEHLERPELNLREWYRLVRVGGYIVIIVPHRDLYERKLALPSRWNGDHKWFFTPSSLLSVVESALPVNSYRVVHMRDNDEGYDYSIGPERHCAGACEIELVLRRIEKPAWEIVNVASEKAKAD